MEVSRFPMLPVLFPTSRISSPSSPGGRLPKIFLVGVRASCFSVFFPFLPTRGDPPPDNYHLSCSMSLSLLYVTTAFLLSPRYPLVFCISWGLFFLLSVFGPQFFLEDIPVPPSRGGLANFVPRAICPREAPPLPSFIGPLSVPFGVSQLVFANFFFLRFCGFTYPPPLHSVGSTPFRTLKPSPNRSPLLDGAFPTP